MPLFTPPMRRLPLTFGGYPITSDAETAAHFVARKTHSATIAARGLRQRGGRSSVLFYSRRIHTWPHEAPEAARPLRSPRDRMLVRCCIPSARYALSAAAVWPPAGLPDATAAGERLIAGHRPTVFGRVASAGAESDCVLEVLECSLTPWAPRSDLHHRSGQGAF